MRRIETYVGEQILEWFFSSQAQNDMVGLAKLSAALFGANSVANGLACTQTSVASMSLLIAPGEFYQMEPLEATVCGTLMANTANTILKQGIQLNSYTTSAFTAPSTSGQSINYLICVQYQDSDISYDPTTGNTSIVPQYYNASNPTVPWSGVNNSGAPSNTFRDGIIAYDIVAGVAATTGAQTNPAVPTGWTALYVVTVPYGATTLTSSNIATYSGAPILPSGGIMSAIQSDLPSYALDTGAANTYAATYSPTVPTVADGVRLRFRAAHANTGASTFNPNGLGAVAILSQQHSALTGSEIIANSDVELVYNSALTAWILLESTGGAQQLPVSSYGVTPTQFDNSTKIATTAFVKTSLGNLNNLFGVNLTGTLSTNTVGSYIELYGSTAAQTLTLPLSTAVPGGSGYWIQNQATVPWTVTRSGSDSLLINTLSGDASVTSFVMAPGDSIFIVSNASGNWYAYGMLSANAFPNSIAGSGYQKLPSGLIIQWGTGVGAVVAGTAVVFPIAFPNACLSISPSVFNGSVGSFTVSGGTPTTTGFNCYSSSGTVTASWVAFGH